MLQLLNEALATEIVCVLRYRHDYFVARGLKAKVAAAEFLQHANQELEHADAISDRDFHGTIKEISAMAKPDFTTWPPVRNFDVVITLSDTDTRLRPGMNGSARLAVDQLRDVLMVPAPAVFQSGGASVVYLAARGGSFERRPVTIVRRNRDQAVVTGVAEGQRIALKEPDVEER